MDLFVAESPFGDRVNSGEGLACLRIEKVTLPDSSFWQEPPETFDDYARYLGINLARIRREAKMSREFLTSLSSLSHCTLTRMECGRANPRLSSICYLSQALETSVIDLLSAPPRVDLRKRKVAQ